MIRWPLFVASLMSGCAGWTPVQQGLIGAQIACIAADYRQTSNWLSDGDEHRYEANPVLGSHPSADKLRAAAAVRLAGTAYLAHALKPEQRVIVFGALDVISCSVVGHNQYLGARVNF